MKPLLPLLLLALAASGVAYLSRPRPPAPQRTRVSVPARSVASPGSSVRPERDRERSVRHRFATPWAALAADDIPAFLSLLREAGCPERTMQTFAMAAVGRRSQQQIEGPIREGIRQSKYWQLGSWEGADTGEPIHERINRAQRALDEELTGLLGVSASGLRRAYRTWGSDEPSLVPEAQQAAFEQLTARHGAERKSLEATMARGVYGQLLDPKARQLVRDLRERQRRELAELLGADLAEQQELRSSPEAHFVRESMPAARDAEEFRRMVAAARATGVDDADASAEQLRQHLPDSARKSAPWARDDVLARFRETTDPERLAEIEREQAEIQRREEERKRLQHEEDALASLATMARAGGVDLTETEVRELGAALRRRGDELNREWGEPPAKPTPEETAALLQKLRVEMERVAVEMVGEKGRAVVAEMVKRQGGPKP